MPDTAVKTPEELAEEERQWLAAQPAVTRVEAPPMRPMGVHGMDRNLLQPVAPLKPVGGTPVAPDIGGGVPEAPSGLQPVGTPSPVKPLSFHERQALPLIGAPGSAENDRSQLARIADQKANPWGSAENHPGTLGKIGHVLGRVGNIAGDIVAPGTMALIPGTDLNRRAQEKGLETHLAGAEQREETAGEHKAAQGLAERKEESEEPLREAQTKATEEKGPAGLAEHGLMRDKDGNIVADPTSPAYQKQQMAGEAVKNLMTLRSAQKYLADAKTEVEQAKNDPNSPAFKAAQQKLAMAQYAHDLAAKNLDLHQQEFGNKVQEQGLLKPSGQAQSRASAAQSVIDLIPGLETLVHKNAASMGPLMGRLNRGEIAIGNVPPDVAELYSAMKSFYALQPAVHGFRNAEFVKDFEHALGTLERDPEAFIAGMKGLKPTLESVAKEGKTFHKRLVEGGGGATPETPAATSETAAPSFADWKKKQANP